MKRRISYSLSILVTIATLLILTSPAAFGAPTRTFGQTSNPGNTTQAGPLKMLDISDDYARQMVMKYGDPSVVPHMKVRIKQPLPDQFQYQESFSANPVPSETAIWEGYDADVWNTPYYATLVRGHFVAQRTSCNCTVGAWVGIGGVHGTGNLFQVGIDMVHMETFVDVIQPGFSPYAHYFYVAYPGDDIYGQVNFDSSTGQWYFIIGDVTQNFFSSNEMSVSPDQNSAEWILEVANPSYPIPFFSGELFSYAWFVVNTGWGGNITSAIANPTYEVYIGPDPNPGCWASPGSVSSDGSSFYARDFC